MVTVLIGVYDLATGKPLMGVVGRPFSPSTKVKTKGGRTQHDFSLALLEAAWYCSGSGHGTTRNEPVQKMLCKLCINLYITQVLNSRVLLMYSDTVKELTGYPVQKCPSGSFLSWGGPAGRGWKSIWYCVNGIPQKDTLDSVAFTCRPSYPIDVFYLSFNFLCLLLL